MLKSRRHMSDKAKALYEEAMDLFAKGKRQESMEMLSMVLLEDPLFEDAYETLGMLCFKAGDVDHAIELTTKLAELKPDYPMAHTNLSIFYMKKGWKEKAEEEKAKATVLSFSKPHEK